MDGTAYQYPITEDFEKRYFKISLTTNYGEYIESVPFVVTKTEEGYFVDFLDSDEDGLPDIYEIMIGTYINKIDSDDDDLTDYQEVYITGTNPTVYDSVTEGISDADADSDEDGLSNIYEIEIGTSPLKIDTDDDDISDYDELYIYGTEPLIPDTDKDGLEDGDELQIGLDPTNPETFGIPDAEYKIEQTISADSGVLAEINTAENAYELSIDIKTNGYAEKEVTVSKSGYSYAIENDAMIGLSADIFISDTCNPEEIVLKYNIKEAYIDNTLNLYSSLDEFQGIKRLNIFKFHEDTNMLLPVNTEFDVENGLLYAEVDELGTYCIMDMEIWLNNLGVEMPEESQHEENAMYFNSPSILSASENSSSVWTPTYTNAPIDLVFILQTAGKSQDVFEMDKSLLKNFSSYIFGKYSNINVHIIAFNKNSAKLLKARNGSENLRNLNDVKYALSTTTYTLESDYCDRGQAFKLLLCDMTLRENTDVFIYEMVNGRSNSYTNYDQMDLMDRKIGSYSEIRSKSLYYEDINYGLRVQNRIEENGDLFITINDSTLSAMIEHFERKKSPQRPAYEILLPTKWKKISLDGELNPYNDIDTDEDTLTDWEEVEEDELIKLSDGNYTLPKVNLKSIFEILKRYDNDEYFFITGNTLPIYYLPILSDPTEKDSDGDGISDDEDLEPLKVYLNELLQKLNILENYIEEYINLICLINKINRSDAPSNSTIAINILRNYGYGTDEFIFFEKPIDELKQWIKWDVTDGSHYPEIRNYINKKDPSLLNFLKKYKLYDKHGEKIDFLHMLATLGAERHNFIDPNLAGWAGDLQSTIRDLRMAKNDENYDSENIDRNVYNLITGDIKVENPKFPMPDLLSDVDAKNISNIYNEDYRLSVILKSYYTYYTNQRFTIFVDNLGGYGELFAQTYEYTHGNDPVKHMILHHFAKKKW